MKKTYIIPVTVSIVYRIEQNLMTSNTLPGTKTEDFNDDGDFDWGDNA